MPQFDVPEPDYDRYTNRQLAAIPLAVLALALVVISVNVALTGAPAPLGVEFAGGTELTVQTTDDAEQIEAAFDPAPARIQSVQQSALDESSNRYILTFGPDVDDQSLREQAQDLSPPPGEDTAYLGSESFDATFAADTVQLALLGIVVAFIGMSVIAFVLFRIFVPSVAIVASAFSDLMIPLAVMGVLGFELTIGTVAALLMLIGYSVDSDILLNNHVLRRGTGGDFYDDVYRAMSTGVTMTVTSMAAMAVMAVAAWFVGIDLLMQIGLLLFVGLAADLMNTYMLNLSLLRWYKFEGVSR